MNLSALKNLDHEESGNRLCLFSRREMLTGRVQEWQPVPPPATVLFYEHDQSSLQCTIVC